MATTSNNNGPIVIGITGYMMNGKDTIGGYLQEFFKDAPKKNLFKKRDYVDARFYSFAQPLKELCAQAFGLPVYAFNDTEQKKEEVVINLSGFDIENNIRPWVDKYIHCDDKWKYLSKKEKFCGAGRSDGFSHILSEIISETFKDDSEVVRSSTGPSFYKTTVRRIAQLMGTEVFRDHVHENFWVDIKSDRLGVIPVWIITDVRFPNEADFVDILIRVTDPRRDNDTTHGSEKFIKDMKPDFDVVNDGTLDDLKKKVRKIYNEIYEEVV